MIPTTQKLMLQVLAALLPGAMTLIYFFGIGVLINLVVAILAALIIESLILYLRASKSTGDCHQTIISQLKDCSAIVTAALFALCLPPFLSVWLVVTGIIFALVFGKHIYGGLGHNVFNPAMVGFAVLILSYPYAMSQWPALSAASTSTFSQTDFSANLSAASIVRPGFKELILIKLGLSIIPDGITAATPLDIIKFRGSQTVHEVWSMSNGFNALAGIGWGWINATFLLGGLYLIKSGVIQFRAPLAMLITLTVLGIFFYANGSSDSMGSPLFHLLAGGTMLGAFFIVTDPVTSPGGKTGQWIFGIGVGTITFIIRSKGAYPEGIAFAILLMNGATPLIDRIRLLTPVYSTKIKDVWK